MAVLFTVSQADKVVREPTDSAHMRGKQNEATASLTSQENIMATINTFPGSPFQRALAAGVQANVPTGVVGEPGQGKTATM